MKCRRGKLSDDTACAKVSLKNVKAMESVLEAIRQKVLELIDDEEMRKAELDESDPDAVIRDVKKAMGMEKKAWMKPFSSCTLM